MSSTLGHRIGEIIITALWPLIWVIYLLASVVIFIEAAAVYLSWRVLALVDRPLKETGAQNPG